MVNCSFFWANQRKRWNENPECWFDCCSNYLFGIYHLQTHCKINFDKTISHLFFFSFFGRVFIGISTLFVPQLQKRLVFATADIMRLNTLVFLFLITMCEQDDGLSPCKIKPSTPNVACIEIYKPVCGCDDTTYSNTCYAEATGVLRWTQGACAD